ncbi:iron complex transport system permease protein [Chitinophaga niastensis]|uniref:Iron complex transport system permease protein n=1 Tax=Chitinophaga niastensis TaxID=536980 RepID=A0A2P8HJF5_CHINA|nr:iron ABC transporter permease [Chitinophaga niastensis]PSL46342.1 iron complex transport system permease protein [Chitinophaga niastensis]
MQLNKQYRGVYPLLTGLLIITMILSACYGAIDISTAEIFHAFGKTVAGSGNLTLHERIFMEIRLPRTLFCLLAGAALAVGGVLLQALFRNPIVEPGLIGTSSGAAFGAALYFVLGSTLHFNTGEWTLPIAACTGAMLATFLVLGLSEKKQAGKTAIVTLLLMGIAINALFLSGTGFLSYIARDPQARSITFWNLGTLSGASWHAVIITSVVLVICFWRALSNARQLNLLILGEEEALLAGVSVQRLKREILIINVVMIAVVTAFTGVISFVGLVVPHFLRIWRGADNRYLIIGSALAGAVLLSLADIAARLLLRPAELPIGIVTSVAGVPVFIFLLRKKNYYF